jgi:hypothetical protein
MVCHLLCGGLKIAFVYQVKHRLDNKSAAAVTAQATAVGLIICAVVF